MQARTLIMTAATFLTCSLAFAATPPRPFLIVAEELAPFEYLGSDGHPEGINVEVIDRIFSDLGVPYEIRFYPWSRAWAMVKNGAADAVLSVSYKDDREESLFFTQEQTRFWETGQIPPDFLWLPEYVFFVNINRANDVHFDTYQQLKANGVRVAISDNYSYDPDFLKAGIETVTEPTPDSAMNTLLTGQADLYPMDRLAGWALLQRSGLQNRITWLPKPMFTKPYLLGFSRLSGYPEGETLMRSFYDKVRELRRSGAMDDITARHVDPFRPARPKRPVLFVCEEWRPFEYCENDQMKGIDVDLVTHIMTGLRIPFEIRTYPWPRAWMMAEQGQADAVLSVSFKDEREKVLYYTDGQRDAAHKVELPKDYLWISRYAFFAKAKNAKDFQFESCEAIIKSGCRVGLNKGYSYASSFPADKFNSKVYFDTASGFMGLIKDEIDIYPMDVTVARHTLKELGIEDSVVELPLKLFSKPYLAPFVRTSDYPGLESIMYEFNYQLRQMRASGIPAE